MSPGARCLSVHEPGLAWTCDCSPTLRLPPQSDDRDPVSEASRSASPSTTRRCRGEGGVGVSTFARCWIEDGRILSQYGLYDTSLLLSLGLARSLVNNPASFVRGGAG